MKNSQIHAIKLNEIENMQDDQEVGSSGSGAFLTKFKIEHTQFPIDLTNLGIDVFYKISSISKFPDKTNKSTSSKALLDISISANQISQKHLYSLRSLRLGKNKKKSQPQGYEIRRFMSSLGGNFDSKSFNQQEKLILRTSWTEKNQVMEMNFQFIEPRSKKKLKRFDQSFLLGSPVLQEHLKDTTIKRFKINKLFYTKVTLNQRMRSGGFWTFSLTFFVHKNPQQENGELRFLTPKRFVIKIDSLEKNLDPSTWKVLSLDQDSTYHDISPYDSNRLILSREGPLGQGYRKQTQFLDLENLEVEDLDFFSNPNFSQFLEKNHRPELSKLDESRLLLTNNSGKELIFDHKKGTVIDEADLRLTIGSCEDFKVCENLIILLNKFSLKIFELDHENQIYTELQNLNLLNLYPDLTINSTKNRIFVDQFDGMTSIVIPVDAGHRVGSRFKKYRINLKILVNNENQEIQAKHKIFEINNPYSLNPDDSVLKMKNMTLAIESNKARWSSKNQLISTLCLFDENLEIKDKKTNFGTKEMKKLKRTLSKIDESKFVVKSTGSLAKDGKRMAVLVYSLFKIDFQAKKLVFLKNHEFVLGEKSDFKILDHQDLHYDGFIYQLVLYYQSVFEESLLLLKFDKELNLVKKVVVGNADKILGNCGQRRYYLINDHTILSTFPDSGRDFSNMARLSRVTILDLERQTKDQRTIYKDSCLAETKDGKLIALSVWSQGVYCKYLSE